MGAWEVTYKDKNGKTITKRYSSMRTATLAVEKLSKKGIVANYCPAYQGFNTI